MIKKESRDTGKREDFLFLNKERAEASVVVVVVVFFFFFFFFGERAEESLLSHS